MRATDRMKSAEAALNIASENVGRPIADTMVAAAQVHATLALVEEQRTANLIAAFERDAIQPPHDTAAANRPFWNALAVDITERLGLS